jgi:DNA-binding transcriptional ArsR family regulator
MSFDTTLAALADPTRRLVFERLRAGRLPVGEIAAGMTVSRAAVSQHLKVLKAAGLVHEQRDGTRRLYSIDPRGLKDLRRWLDRFWDGALEAFRLEVEQARDA